MTEKSLLEEVAKELGFDISDVNRTYDIWLDFLNHIANETDQASITFPQIGQMYISVHRLRRARQKELKERKLKEIEKLRDNCENIVHEKSVPIILKYGVAKRKKSYENGERIYGDFFTPREIIDNQNKIFFNEDIEYSEQSKLMKYFIGDENN